MSTMPLQIAKLAERLGLELRSNSLLLFVDT